MTIHIDSGRLQVVGAPEDDATSREVHLGGRADALIRVAHDCRVEIHGDDADIRVSGVGGLEAHLDSGTIDATDVTGRVEIRADRADVSLDSISGDVDVHVDSGEITALRVGGRIQIAADSGDVTVQAVSDHVEVSVDSGDVVLDLVPTGRARYEVHADSGAVTVRLPADVGVRADLTSDSGDVLNDVTAGDDVTLAVVTDSGDITVLAGVPALG